MANHVISIGDAGRITRSGTLFFVAGGDVALYPIWVALNPMGQHPPPKRYGNSTSRVRMLGVRPLRAALFQHCFKPVCCPHNAWHTATLHQDRVHHHQNAFHNDCHADVSTTYKYSPLFENGYDPGTLFPSATFNMNVD